MRKKASKVSPSIMVSIPFGLPSINTSADRKKTREERNINGTSFQTVECSSLTPFIHATMPRMSRMLAMLEPTTLPTAMSVTPLIADVILTESSGADVPNATIVRPMTSEDTPRRFAKDDAPSTSKFADFTKAKRETTTMINERSMEGNLQIGGEGGIRTLDTLSGIHDFESCAFDHSATSPRRLKRIIFPFSYQRGAVIALFNHSCGRFICDSVISLVNS